MSAGRVGLLALLPPSTAVPAPPPDRGRLLTAAQVAAELFSGTVRPRWVMRRVQAGRVMLGRSTVRWFELDVRAWIAERSGPRGAA